MDNLFLVEHQWEVRSFLKKGLRNKGQWIALGPSAMFALDKENIPYKIPEDFYSVSKLEEICLVNHEKVEELCNKLDNEILNRNPQLKEYGIRPFLFNIFPLIILFDGIISRIFQLKAILDFFPSYTIWIHIRPWQPWGMFDILFSNQDTLWGHILALNGWSHEINFISEEAPKAKTTLCRQVLQKVKEYIKKFMFLNQPEVSLEQKNQEAKKGFKTKGSFLVYGFPYNWKYTYNLFGKKGWGIVFSNDQMFKITPTSSDVINNTINEIINSDPDLISYFQYRNISFYSLVYDRLAWIYKNGLAAYSHVSEKMKTFIEQYNIKAILTTINTSIVSYMVNQIGRHYALPVIRWQHGFVFYNNRISQLNEFNDLMGVDLLMVFGEEVAAAYRPYLNKFRVNVICVGSAELDNLRTKENISYIKHGRKISILYATTNFYFNYWYCGIEPPFIDRFFYNTQLQIMNGLNQILKSNQEVSLTVKLHPLSDWIDPPWIKDFKNKRINYIKSIPSFSELIFQSDVIIIDIPTTTNLQAISTKRPVFVLTRHLRLPQRTLQILKKRAVCEEDSAELIAKVAKYIKEGIYCADVNDTEFLELYGIYRNDGESAKRAMEAVESILYSKKSFEQKFIARSVNV